MERTNSMLGRKASLRQEHSFADHGSRPFAFAEEKTHFSPQELEQTIDRILKGTNPNVTSTPVYFDFNKDARTYKFIPALDHTAMHFSIDGNSVLASSEEARRLEDEKHRRLQELERAEEAERNPDLVEQGVSTRILKNQFNYSDRASQTMNNPLKTARVITDPPPSITFSNTATAWEIFDAYEEDRINNERALAAGKKGKKDEDKRGQNETRYGDAAEEIMASPALLSSLKVMERMVNQNDSADIIDDYKYWEDQSDMYKDDGNLLPLWKFHSDKVKKKSVTCVTWNPRYNDLFAVGYGSYDFQKQGGGMILCYTLKNAFPTSFQGQMLPAHPEFVFNTESGVMCLDYHPTESGLLACGLYDGTVCVFDLHQKVAERRMRPLFQSTVKSGKHTDPVWQVRWSREADVLRFFSVSTDGRVVAWTVAKSELSYTDVIRLSMTDTADAKDDPEAALIGLSGGMCIDFSPTNENIFVVGTQEGLVRRCSKAFNAHYLDTYEGHSMAVYGVQWNPFHSDIFITCSADWTVKVWLRNSRRPLMTFDLGDAVGDVVWAPYSSTVFAAVTTNGKVLVYDLSKNKNEPLCTQGVVKNAKLTHICFNPRDPIVLVGDSRGTVLSLKLSPNLRQVCKAEKGQPSDAASIRQLEVEKLNRLVEIILKDRELLDR